MESPSKFNETSIDEFHKQEAERASYIRILAASILVLGLIVAGIFIYCVRHYQRISVKIRARVAEGGLDYVAACLVPFLVFFWMVVGWIMEVGFGIGRVCKGVKDWVRPVRPRAATARGLGC